MTNTLFDAGEYRTDKHETLKQRYEAETARYQDRLAVAKRDAEDAFRVDSENETVSRVNARIIFDNALAAQRELLHYEGTHDGLTGALNREGFREKLVEITHEVLTKRATGEAQEEKSVLIFFIDANDFKALNDTHGHDIGDQGLINLAQEIYAHMRHDTSAERRSDNRPEDLVARLGGDEFVVAAVVESVKIDIVLKLLADRLEDIEFETGGETFKVGASVGHAAIPLKEVTSPEQLQDLMKDADGSMYEAKGSRKELRRQQELSNLASAIVKAVHPPVDNVT